MAKNFVKDGKRITLTAAAAVTSGQAVRAEALLGVAMTDAAIGEAFEAGLDGVWRLPKTSADIIAPGDLLDWDESAGEIAKGITPAAGDIQNVGVAMAAAGAGILTIDILLTPGTGTLN